jgi:hypothetical protein
MENWINMRLLGEPYNWLVVSLVIIFGAFAMFVIYAHMNELVPRIPAW